MNKIIDIKSIDLAASALKAGNLVIIPTETVYGLAANALDPEAVKKIYAAKNRASTNPLIVHVSSIDEIHKYADLSNSAARKNFELLSPLLGGPLTLVLPKKDLIPDIITAGGNSVAIRVPAHAVTLELLKRLNFPLAAPSANISKKLSPTQVKHLDPELLKHVAYVIEGGPCKYGIESTVVALRGEEVVLLRPGAISLEELRKIIPNITIEKISANATSQSPGQELIHYQPKKRMIFVDQLRAEDQKYKIAFLSFGRILKGEYQVVFKKELLINDSKLDSENNLFNFLHEMDNSDAELLVCDKCETSGMGLAIMDRLNRAVSK